MDVDDDSGVEEGEGGGFVMLATPQKMATTATQVRHSTMLSAWSVCRAEVTKFLATRQQRQQQVQRRASGCIGGLRSSAAGAAAPGCDVPSRHCTVTTVDASPTEARVYGTGGSKIRAHIKKDRSSRFRQLVSHLPSHKERPQSHFGARLPLFLHH